MTMKMKKDFVLKILIILNGLYFLITCLMTYKWWGIDYFDNVVSKPYTLKGAFKTFLSSGLVEEFGIISYLF